MFDYCFVGDVVIFFGVVVVVVGLYYCYGGYWFDDGFVGVDFCFDGGL